MEIIQSESPIKIVVIMACHNRANLTGEFFNHLLASKRENFVFEFIVCDDGSTDGTSKTLESQPLPIKIVNGTGNLFWAKSMALAEANIEGISDGILWVNDDLRLSQDAFQTLMGGILARPNSVLIGQVRDQDSERIIYGGYRRLGRHPLKVQLVSDSEAYLSVDTFNGNFVYIPTQIRLAVGPIDSFYQHAYADIDYGYRVKKAGYEIYTLPKVIGTGFENKITWPKGIRNKLRQHRSAKFNPTASQIHFFRNHTGTFWFLFLPFYLIRPIFKVLILNSGKPSVFVKD
jgi:GT2 family glycosyltransferase